MKQSIIFCAVIIAAIMLSCKQEHATQFSNYDKYSIANDTNWVEVTDTSLINITCLDGSKMNNLHQFIFRNQGEYSMLDTLRVNDEIFKNCVDYKHPVIDFENYSLIGLLTRTGFCDINRNIYRNDKEKKLYYLVEITNIGVEEIMITNYNLLRIPKIPSEYDIMIDTILKYRFDE